ncbi:hypothetical protein SAMN05428937_3760 [Achromobacter sp. MFA1 R4]|nr:hypothetical protein SAMN05428937_3760 [Achromobacter sp. MFA1 R4]
MHGPQSAWLSPFKRNGRKHECGDYDPYSPHGMRR